MGGKLANGPEDCTHLVMEKIVRTAKFLACLNTCKYIISPNWIKDSVKNKAWEG
jgi:PAX-interacting protein 1